VAFEVLEREVPEQKLRKLKLPFCIFSHRISTNWFRSGRLCSCQNPTACIISCMMIPLVLQRLPSDRFCSPLRQYILPMYDQHLRKHQRWLVKSYIAPRQSLVKVLRLFFIRDCHHLTYPLPALVNLIQFLCFVFCTKLKHVCLWNSLMAAKMLST
jgi:hypothetical protein